MSAIPNREKSLTLEFKKSISSSVKRPYDYAFSGQNEQEESPKKKQKTNLEIRLAQVFIPYYQSITPIERTYVSLNSPRNVLFWILWYNHNDKVLVIFIKQD